jgi:hypothetical protein
VGGGVEVKEAVPDTSLLLTPNSSPEGGVEKSVKPLTSLETISLVQNIFFTPKALYSIAQGRAAHPG